MKFILIDEDCRELQLVPEKNRKIELLSAVRGSYRDWRLWCVLCLVVIIVVYIFSVFEIKNSPFWVFLILSTGGLSIWGMQRHIVCEILKKRFGGRPEDVI